MNATSSPGDDEIKQSNFMAGERLQYQLRNISEGIAIGNYSFIAGIQKKYKRKFIRPRSFLEVEGNRLFVTRVLRL